MKRSFSFMDKDMFLTFLKSIVCPHLKYGSNIWSVIYNKEVIQLENVQMLQLVKNISQLNYTERLKQLELPSLQNSRLRAGMVETGIKISSYPVAHSYQILSWATNFLCKIQLNSSKILHKKYDLGQQLVFPNFYPMETSKILNNIEHVQHDRILTMSRIPEVTKIKSTNRIAD